ncbi:MAG TPA: hypothetical protein VEW03_02140 [Longimicrobiaceae bacterium]|nr:hypothetical protein [Longimicrobiaceae bacterium]
MSDGYQTETIEHDGHRYTFRFYKGFARRVGFKPAGGDEIEVYDQKGVVFHVAQNGGSGKGPDARSTINITGGPHNYDIEVEIDDSPQHPEKLTGPVKRVELGLQPRGTPFGTHHPNAKAVRGHEHLARITVHSDRGGVHAMQGGGGDEVTFDNTPITCPPFC